MAAPTHITHIVYRFDTGGLENGIVNLINHLPAEHYRHSVVCLSGFEPEFVKRITQPIHIETIDKQPGPDWKYYLKMWRILRRLAPDIVHTRNMATLEYQIPAALAGVKHRIHGEHGWDMSDLAGENRRYLTIKKMLKPLIHDFIGLSGQSVDYLIKQVGVRSDLCHRIINGVDTMRFNDQIRPPNDLPDHLLCDQSFVIGTVGRMAQVKNQSLLVEAFIALCQQHSEDAVNLRLVLIGDGELFHPIQQRIAQAGLSDKVWMPGNRSDIALLMRQLDLFVLPSLAEGISNTLLEAMASGLPCIATDVGGNSELIIDGDTGTLIDSDQVERLAEAVHSYLNNRPKLQQQSIRARQRAVSEFSLERMVKRYADVYDQRKARQPFNDPKDRECPCAE